VRSGHAMAFDPVRGHVVSYQSRSTRGPTEGLGGRARRAPQSLDPALLRSASEGVERITRAVKADTN